MKVKDAILKLQSMDPEAIIIKRSDNFEQGNSMVGVRNFVESKDGELREEHFRDAFDGTNYTSKVWRTSGGNQPIVRIY